MAIEDTAQTTILAIGVDTGNSVQELQKISTAATGMGNSISNAAEVSAAALERQGAAQEAAAKASKRSTDSAVRTLQTEIAAREAGGRATARYYELIYASSSKVDQQAIAPLIAKYKELEAQQVAAAAAAKTRAETEKKAAQEAAAAIKAQADALKAQQAAAAVRSTAPIGVFGGLPDISGGTRQLEQMGMTAKATSAALRQVPAQFTDIVVSLQGGQAPLTVFLQQGGQLKDVFGGAGAAAAALGKYVLGLINPVTLAAAAVAALAYGYNQGATEVQRFNAALITTSNAAGATAGGLADLAAQAAKTANVTKGAAAEVVTAFAQSGAFRTDQIERFSAVAIRAQRDIGRSVSDTISAFEKLGQKPLEASLKLNEGTNYLTRSVYEQIKALEEQGRVTEAAAVAQNAYADNSDRVANKLEQNLGTIERGWLAVKNATKGVLDTLLEVGRAPTPSDAAANVASQIAATRRLLEGGTGANGLEFKAAAGAERERLSERLAGLEKIAQRLKDQHAAEEGIAAAEAASVKQLQAKIELDKIVDKSLDKRVTTEREVAALRDKYGKQAANDATIALKLEEAIASVRAKAADKVPKVAVKVDENQRELAQYIESLEKRIDKEKELTEVQKAQRIIGKAATSDANAQVQAYALSLAEQADIEAKNAEARKAATKAQADYNKELANSATSVEKTVQKYKDEAVALELSRAGNISLEAAINDVTIARLEEQALLEYQKGNFDGLAAIQKEIAARRELAKEIRSKDVREASDKAAKDAATAWEKASDKIGDSITDSLLRGFESGKGIVQNLIDTTEAAFKTMVLQPTIRAAVEGVFGLGGGGGTAGSNPFSSIAQIASSFEKASLAFTDFKLFSTNAAYDLGGSLTSAGFDKAGSLVTANASQIGSLANTVGRTLGYLEAASNFKDGSYGKSIGQAVGTYFGGPIGSVIGKELGAAVDRLFGGGEYVQSLGETVATITADKVVKLGGSGGTNDVSIGGGINIRQTDVSDKFVNNLASAFVSAASKLGVSTAGASFGAGFNNSDGGKFAVEATVGGKKYDPGQVKYTDANLALEASRAVFFALQSSELPGYLSKVFDGITASTAAQADIDAALNYAGSLKTIRDALTETRTPLEILQDSVASAFTALGSSADTFKTDFVAAIDQGITPDKLAEYLALGQNLDALAQASGTASEAVKDVGRSLADITSERKSLDERYAQATLNEQQLIDRTRESIDASNQVRYDEVIAAEAAKTAAEKLADAQTEAAEKAKAAADQLKATNDSLKDRLDVLTGAQTDRSLQLRDATDATTKSLLDQIFAQEDLQAASAKTAQAISDAIATQRSAVQKYSASLNADTARTLVGSDVAANFAGKSSDQIREMARVYAASLDTQTEAGRAAITQFNSLTPAIDFFISAAEDAAKEAARAQGDAAKAAEDAAKAAEDAAKEAARAQADAAKAAEDAAGRVRDAMKSIADTLLSEAARIRGDLQIASTQSLSTAQARFAITAAQARSGDAEAAKLLPELARTVTELAATNAVSANELRNVRASTASTLEDVAKMLANQYGFQTPAAAAVGAATIIGPTAPYQPLPATVAPAQPIFFNSMTSAAPQADGGDLVAEMEQLRALVQTLIASNDKIAASNDVIRLTLLTTTRNGTAMQVAAEAPGLLTRT